MSALLAPIALLALQSCPAAIVSPYQPAIRCRHPIVMKEPTRAERLVRERLNPRASLDEMTDKQLRKYAYAMQIELQRLIREECNCNDLRRQMRVLLDEQDTMEQTRLGSTILIPELLGAMKMEGLVRYGMAYANANTAWDKVRENNPEFADNSDEELFAAFKASGRGISSTFGDLW